MSADSGVVEHAFCKLCRIHHDMKRRHLFTNKHKGRLARVLSKFKTKIKDARQYLKKPVVEEGEVEPGMKIWCYCCDAEVDKHVTDREMSIIQGGVLEHLASSDHHKNTRRFWHDQGANISEQPFFLLHQLDYERYKEAAVEAVKAVEARLSEKQKNDVAVLRHQEIQRASLYSQSLSSSQCLPVWNTATQCTANNWLGSQLQHSKSNTQSIPAYGSGVQHCSLTAINRTRSGSSRGNVHTGAVPPWLRSDDGVEVLAIGPSEKLFRAHLASKKKGSKNPKRVGAEFMENMKRMKQEDDTWLPSFGRVWNHGPRLHSKLEYMDERGLRRSRKRRTDIQKTECDASDRMTEKQTDLFNDRETSCMVVNSGEREVCMNLSAQHSTKQWPLTSSFEHQFQTSSSSRPLVGTILPNSSTIISQQTTVCSPSSQPSAIPSRFGGFSVPPVDMAVRGNGYRSLPDRPGILSEAWPSDIHKLSTLSEELLKQKQELLQSLNRRKEENNH